MIRSISVILLFVASLLAQTVNVSNESKAPFSGYVSATVDRKPQHSAGMFNDGVTTFVVGRQLTESLWRVDIKVTLKSGEKKRLNFASSRPLSFILRPMPADPLNWFGGQIKSVGRDLEWVSLRADGASYLAHLRARVGVLTHLDLWVQWYPDWPAFAFGDALITASNPSNGNVRETIAPPGIDLVFGDAWVIPKGSPLLVAPGTSFGSGQARAIPIVFTWQRHLIDEGGLAFASLGALVGSGVNAVGDVRLYPEGNPHLEPGFDVAKWTQSQWDTSIARLHTWEPMLLGPNPISGDTGAQKDQMFPCGQPLLNPGSLPIVFWNACKFANRPCHHLMADGSMLDASKLRERLVLWDMVPHWHRGVSPERLGKSEDVTRAHTNGWWGADTEHWLINSLVAGWRLTGRPMLGRLLETHAVNYPLQWTVDRQLSTTMVGASRAQGYEARNVLLLYENLEDRVLARRTRDHFDQRFTLVFVPHYERMLAQHGTLLMDARLNDPRLGQGQWRMPWQDAVGAYGLYVNGTFLQNDTCRDWGIRFAQDITRRAWFNHDRENRPTRWQSAPVMPIAEGAVINRDESFNYFGMNLAPTVVVHSAIHGTEEEVARATDILQQLNAALLTNKDAQWLSPLIPR